MTATKTLSLPGLLMHEIKVQVQNCNRGKVEPEVCRDYLVETACRYLELGLDLGTFDPTAWDSRFSADQRRARATLVTSQRVKDILEDLRLKVERQLLEAHIVRSFSLADIIEMGVKCMKQRGFDIQVGTSLLEASSAVGLQRYASFE